MSSLRENKHVLMTRYEEMILRGRRDFLTSTASGIGLLALASMFGDDGLLAAESPDAAPLFPKAPPRSPYMPIVQMAERLSAAWRANGG